MATSSAQSHSCTQHSSSWCDLSYSRSLSSSRFGPAEHTFECPRAIALVHVFIQRWRLSVASSQPPWRLRCEALRCDSAKVSLIELVHQRRIQFQQQQQHQKDGAEKLMASAGAVSSQTEISEEISTLDLRLSQGQIAYELEEAKVLLTDYLKKETTDAPVSLIVSRSTRFLVHLVFLMHWHYHIRYLSRSELTTMEIRATLQFYLESLGAEQGSNFIDYIQSFPASLPPESGNHRAPPQTEPMDPPKSIRKLKTEPIPKIQPKIQQLSDLTHLPSLVYLSSLGMTREQVATIHRRCPQIVQYKVEENMKPVISFCLSLGVQPSEIPGMVLKRPQLLRCNVITNLQQKINYLQTLGVQAKRFPKILVYFPHMLTYSQRKVSAVYNFLVHIGLSAGEAATVLGRFPHVVGYSVQRKLEPMSSYLSTIGIDQVSAIIVRSPQTLGLSLEDNVKPTVKFFTSIGFSKEELVTMITRFPQILGLNLNQNLRKKWEFFCQMGYPRLEIVKFPQYFGYHLEKRIIPRYQILVANNLKWGINKLLTDTESTFLRKVKRAVTSGRKSKTRYPISATKKAVTA